MNKQADVMEHNGAWTLHGTIIVVGYTRHIGRSLSLGRPSAGSALCNINYMIAEVQNPVKGFESSQPTSDLSARRTLCYFRRPKRFFFRLSEDENELMSYFQDICGSTCLA